MVNHFRNVSTVRVDHWLEWDTTTVVSRRQIVNPDGGDMAIDEPLHMPSVTGIIFCLVSNAKK